MSARRPTTPRTRRRLPLRDPPPGRAQASSRALGRMRPELPFELKASGVIAVLQTAGPDFLLVLAAYAWDAGVGTIEVPVTSTASGPAITALSATPATVG